MKLYALLFLCFFFYQYSYSASQTVGSDTTTSSPEDYWKFDGVENKISNYAQMSGGFTMQDLSSTCSFYSLFPVESGLFLNGGKLYLNRDLNFNNVFAFGGGGEVFGNGYKIKLPKHFSQNRFFDKRIGTLNFLDSYNVARVASSADWSYNDQYVASTNLKAPGSELYVSSFDGSILSILESVSLPRNTRCIRWHPNSYYLAVGQDTTGGNDLIIYSWDSVLETLSITDGADVGSVTAVSWSNDGQYLAIGNGLISIYSFSLGILTYVTEVALGGPLISENALEWNDSGTYLVAGMEDVGLQVYSFNGSTLTLDASASFGTDVATGVSWRPNSSVIASTWNGATNGLKLFLHTSGILKELSFSRIDDLYAFYEVDWTSDGDNLAVAIETQVGFEIRLFYFDIFSYRLFQVSGYDLTDDVNDVRFSNDDQFILTADSANDVSAFNLVKKSSVILDNVNLVFNSDTKIEEAIFFSGNCSINGKGKSIIIDEALGGVQVETGSCLTFYNLELKGIANNNLRCASNSSSLCFQDCKLTLSSVFTFDTGSMLFKGDVIISGTNKFVYSSSVGSTINSNSILCFDKGVPFYFSPSVLNRDLLYMTDETSYLFFDGATLISTETGLRLTRGTLLIDNNVTFSALGSSISEAICIGDGTVENDLNIKILSDAQLNIWGAFEYKNTY